jgi:hypothetical protein
MAAQESMQRLSTSLWVFQYLAVASNGYCQACRRTNFFGTLYERSYNWGRLWYRGHGHVNAMYSRDTRGKEMVYDAFLGRRKSCEV